VRDRALAVYRVQREGRYRLAVLVWQRDDPRVEVDGASPGLLVLTMDLEPDPGADNVVSIRGFESLEAARAACVEWVGDATESDVADLPETAEIALYASIREPGFARR
jgi:hypothetical protein